MSSMHVLPGMHCMLTKWHVGATCVSSPHSASPRPSSPPVHLLDVSPRHDRAPSMAFPRRAARSAAAANDTVADGAPSSAVAAASSPERLEHLLGWLQANGVQGLGPGGKVGVYADDGGSGERGLAALKTIRTGETLFVVPLRLAIFDDPSDPEDMAAAPYPGAPWSVRLAWKLLRLRAQGGACPWAAYLEALPGAVPAPLVSYSWGGIDAARSYEPMARQLDYASWLQASAWSLLPRTLGTTRLEFEWALSVVHSRTFGTAGRRGGVGARMLVPLVDLLNHGGDVATAPHGAADPGSWASDNARWDVLRKIGGEVLMAVTATRDIEGGEEVLLSYGERTNDEWFLHYGFVPPRNPHDDVALFESIEAAIDWHLEKYVPKGTLTPVALQQAIIAAYEAAQKEEDEGSIVPGDEMQSDGSGSTEDSELIRAEQARIKLLSGGRVEARVAAAFSALHATARVAQGPVHVHVERHVSEAVAARATEVLISMRTSHQVDFLEDLKALAAWEAEMPQQRAAHGFAEASKHYNDAIERNPAAQALLQRMRESDDGFLRRKGDAQAEVPGEKVVDAGAAAVENAALLALLRRERERGTAHVLSGDEDGGRDYQDEAESAGLADSSREDSMLPLVYRAYKCCILWDCVLLGSLG